MRILETIPGTSFDIITEKCLIDLLEKVRNDNCRWPTEECMRVAHGVCPYPACELVITRNPGEGMEILLAKFDGGFEGWKNFWHLPGGYVNQMDGADATIYEDSWGVKSLQPVVDRIAIREIGVRACINKILNVTFWPPRSKKYPWREASGAHPYGRPVSLWLDCTMERGFQETYNIRFFPLTDLPGPIVKTHIWFMANHFGLF